jgi:hypothetical protein
MSFDRDRRRPGTADTALDALSCRVPRVCVDQSRRSPSLWLRACLPVRGIGAAPSVEQPVSAAMRRTRSAASAPGISAAVTNSGRAEDLRTTGHRVGGRAEPELGHDNRDAELGVRMCTQVGPTAGGSRSPATRSDRPVPREAAGSRAGTTLPRYR